MTAEHDVETIFIAHPSPELYGSDRVLIESVAGLAARGFRVVVALPQQGPLAPALEQAGAEIRFLPVPVLRKNLLHPRAFATFIGHAVRAAVAGTRLLGVERPRAVVVNTATIPVWILAAKLRGLPVLLHVHESERNAHRLLRLALALPGTFCQGIVTNSRYSTQSLSQAAPWLKRKITVVYNGVPGPKAPSAPRQELDTAARVLFVGRLSERKGAHTAIRALRILQEEGRDVQLSMLGAAYEGYEWFLEQLHQETNALPNPQAVRFLGFDNPVWPHYEDCDLAIVPSTVDEPFGNTAVEAVLAQRPVVVSRIGGLPEAVNGLDSALLVPADSPEALAQGIATIIDEFQEYRQMAQVSLEQARVSYDPQTYGQKFASQVQGLFPPSRSANSENCAG